MEVGDDKAEKDAEGEQENGEAEGTEVRRDSRNEHHNQTDGVTGGGNEGRSNQGTRTWERSTRDARNAAMSETVLQSHLQQKVKSSSTMLKEMRSCQTYACMKCGNKYRQNKWYEAHVEKCRQDPVNGRSVDISVRLAHSMVYTDKSVETYKRHDQNLLTKDITVNPDEDYRVVRRGWVKEPKKGTSLGENNIEEFQVEVKRWFEIGSARPVQELSAARMLHLLEEKYPMRYDLPTEKQINSLITKFSGEEKKESMDAAASRIDYIEARAGGSAQAQNVGNAGSEEAPSKYIGKKRKRMLVRKVRVVTKLRGMLLIGKVLWKE